MNAHPYIERLAQFRGTTLSVAQLAEVLGKRERFARKLLMRGTIAHLKESVGVNSPDDHQGSKWRREITVGAVLIYLINITEGDKTDILEAIAQRLPEHHEMCVRHASNAAPVPLPEGVLDARAAFQGGGARKTKRHPKREPMQRAEYQPDLFESDSRQAVIPA